ncbi:permease [Pseudomonas ovata]|uniref:permease n=1 Tax=Pseudomonas ovata TaxID=1839709 RepID=UPI000D68725D|nr:permease [Pseudomonas ovata]
MNSRKTQHPKTTKHPAIKSTLMKWSIKAINQSPSDIRAAFYFCFGTPIICISGLSWWLWPEMEIMFGFWLGLCMATIVFPMIFLAILRQKTVFNYKIQLDYGEVEHQLYFPDFASDLFQGLAAFAILIFVGVALLTGSLLFLLGPAAIAVGSAMTLMNWEKPPVVYERSMSWNDHDFVTVDRKYLIIVAHHTDTTIGFKARFPDKALFEQYLAFLRTVVAPHAEFTEKVWEW